MNREDKIFIAGHRGLVGSAVFRELIKRGYHNLLTASRDNLDLTDPVVVKWFFSTHAISEVFLCAAKVGGVAANAADPLGFFLQNQAIQTNVITQAAAYNVHKLVFLGSSCIFPAGCEQPIKESALLTGLIEPNTEPYALAKICGIRLCQWYKKVQGKNFVSAIPCNLYGQNDNYSLESSHCIAGLIRRLRDAREAKAPEFYVWGDGTARREFLNVDDLARALVLLMESYEENEPINVGSGVEVTMDSLARTLARIIGYEGEIKFDSSKITGSPRKLLDSSKIRALGWAPQVDFTEGLCGAYDSFLDGSGRVM